MYAVADSVLYWHLETFGRIPLVPNAPPTVFENNILVQSWRNAVPHTGSPKWMRQPLVMKYQGYTNSKFSKNIIFVTTQHGTQTADGEGQPLLPLRFLDGVACTAHFHTPPNRTCTKRSADTFNHSTWNHNLYFNTTDQGHYLSSPTSSAFATESLEQWRARGHDQDSLVADPQFVDAAAGTRVRAREAPCQCV